MQARDIYKPRDEGLNSRKKLFVSVNSAEINIIKLM